MGSFRVSGRLGQCRTAVIDVRTLWCVAHHRCAGALAFLPRARSGGLRAPVTITCQDGSTKQEFANWTTDAVKEESRKYRRTVSSLLLGMLRIGAWCQAVQAPPR